MGKENEAEVSPLLAGMHELKLAAEQGCAYKIYPESAKAIREKMLAQQEEIIEVKCTFELWRTEAIHQDGIKKIEIAAHQEEIAKYKETIKELMEALGGLLAITSCNKVDRPCICCEATESLAKASAAVGEEL